jgi:hypothetical protein
MQTRYIILFTVLGTLLIQYILLSFWLTRDLLLVLIDPLDRDSIYVLTKDTLLEGDDNATLMIQKGTIFHGPCQHDRGYTEPYDPQIWKLYIYTNLKDCVPLSAWTNKTVTGFGFHVKKECDKL